MSYERKVLVTLTVLITICTIGAAWALLMGANLTVSERAVAPFLILAGTIGIGFGSWQAYKAG